MASKKKFTILVSSTVYGFEELLDRIYTLLTTFGYEVWMSHKGTVPVFSSRSAFDNCVSATEKCDLFLGIITPSYGSGQDGSGLSITHIELKKAIELNKPRWLLAHDHVVFARSLLNQLDFKGRAGRSSLVLKRSPILDDLRVIDMYEDAIREETNLPERQGNWVQKFESNEDAALFLMAQFSRYQEVEAFMEEQFKEVARISALLQGENDSEGQP